MTKNIIGIAVASALAAGCASTSAPSKKAVEGPVESNSSYVADAAGNVVLSGAGQCLNSGAFNKDMALPGCDPDAAAMAMAEAEAAEKAAAEKAAMEKAAAEKAAAEKAAAEKAAAEKAAMAAAEPVVMNLSGKTLFSSGSSDLSGEGEMALQKLTQQLGAYKSIDSVTVVGHSDSTGPAEMNLELSKMRAESVRDYIVNSGAAGGAEINVMGMGEINPVASNDTADGRRQNRRVEVKVRGTK